ncbi:hypothetical protein CAL26_27975 [Bordetella genomosp. 9]|uniref:Carbon monoxide dehydrogenase n=1 Tax=Bordetella genomosp. 9 TaxID=1416803 RepID=A0A261R8D8_9BORD|nr:SRPBCC family protein [Bordetella genomosp. 9]OZI21269.1 hypothetical protein CAL26_27975 [Bordetella genomosp. 9]
MEFTNTFHVPLPLEEAWQLMLDVPRILPCLPGARLTEVLGDDRYKGSVSVRLGPIRLSFDGEAALVRRDEARHIAWLEGSGTDAKGRGSARSEFSFALTPAADGTQVTVTTQLALSGSVAQYGRGSGMIAEVAAQILGQFERNLAQSLALDDGVMADAAAPAMTAMTGEGGASAPAATAPRANATASAGGPAVTPNPHTGSVPAQGVDAQAVLLQAQAVLSQAQAVLALAQSLMVQGRQRAAGGAAPAAELNMLSIGAKAMWARLRYGLAGLFGRRP